MSDGSTLDGVQSDGVFVVVQTHHTSPDRPIGVALTLDAAMRIVLEAGEFELYTLVGADENGEHEWAMQPVNSENMAEAVKRFRWVDESTCGKRYPSRFAKGEYAHLDAYFQDEATVFTVWWTDLRA